MIQIIKHRRNGSKGDSDWPVCKHKHTSIKAARRCAKTNAYGLAADGSETTVAIYVDDLVVEQYFAVSVVRETLRTFNWRTRVECVLPHSPLWRKIKPVSPATATELAS